MSKLKNGTLSKGNATTTPKLKRVIRLDSVPLEKATYTEEGYLVDTPIMTSTGIFEYTNPDGTIRRELRLPEEVFAPESLASYRGKPVCITHDAGLITKDNVHEESIGTILSEGFRDGDSVRAKIIIHDTDAMKRSKLKELSLGYNLDLDETPGVWRGQPYDAIQRNITINHLALVVEARAGEQARLNIDSRDRKQKGANSIMRQKKTVKRTRRGDGVLSPEELEAKIAEYKLRRAQRLAEKNDEDETTAPPQKAVQGKGEPLPVEDEDDTTVSNTEEESKGENEAPDETEKKLQMVKDRRDRRDEESDPTTTKEAMGVIAQQDDDIDVLFDIIDTLLAERDFDGCNRDEDETETGVENVTEKPTGKAVAPIDPANEDEDEETEADEPVNGEEENADDDDDVIPNTNEAEAKKPVLNADSVDSIVRQRIQLGIVGRALNMDGLENMKISQAKKAVIRAVRPGIRLDGKSKAYIDAAFDCAVADVKAKSRKDTTYQKHQIFNQDSRYDRGYGESSAAARQRMIDRHMNKKEDK